MKLTNMMKLIPSLMKKPVPSPMNLARQLEHIFCGLYLVLLFIILYLIYIVVAAHLCVFFGVGLDANSGWRVAGKLLSPFCLFVIMALPAGVIILWGIGRVAREE